VLVQSGLRMRRKKVMTWMVLVGLTLGLVQAEEKAKTFPLQSQAGKGSKEAVETKKESGSVITGQATIQLRNQLKSVLGRMELVLCPEAIQGEIKSTRDERWRLLASRANFNDGYNNLDLQAIGTVAVRQAVMRAKSNEEGVYRFEKVPAGSYVVYGQYRSKYAVAYWLVPVKVEAGREGQEIKVDLNETNVKEAHNKFD
jgi:hypothetical protein